MSHVVFVHRIPRDFVFSCIVRILLLLDMDIYLN